MISIIMPAYNAENHIADAVNSVLNQTYKDWELIIIDDCSIDKTKSIIEQLLMSTKNIRYFRNTTNQGTALSRNIGISHAKGEWIAFLDSDDCWRSDKLIQQLQCAQETKAVFLFSGSSFINAQNIPLNYYLEVPPSISFKQLLKQNLISCSSVLIKRDLMIHYPMEHSADMHEDFAVWLRILRDNDLLAYGINEPLLIYRVYPSSKSGNKIKAGIMTYRVYRHIGLSLIPAIYYWSCYFIRSLKKYRHLV